MSREAGFTLIESLVALAILAVSATSLLLATEGYVRRIDNLEARALAQLAAENRLAEIEIGLKADRRPTVLLGRAFELSERRAPTRDPDLYRIDLDVTDHATGATYGGFIGFVATRSPP